MRTLLVVWLWLAPSLAMAQRVSGPGIPPFCPLTDSLGVLITFFDVGQGDATLIESPGGRRALIDGGPSAQRVAGELRALGVVRLELVVASHNHLDHIGGLPAVLGQLTVSNVMSNEMPATTNVYRRFLSVMESSGANVLRPTARTIRLDSVSIRVLPPAPGARAQNNASIGLLVSLGAFRAAFTGDAEGDALGSWLTRENIPAVTLLKASHHGSITGFTTPWANATRPTLVVFPVGAGNSYGHPAPSVMRYWQENAREVLRTDLDGTVRVRGCRDGSYTTSTARMRVADGA
jgi:competence protein ComEC